MFFGYFNNAWKTAVLRAEPERKPVGWRGYMLARGLVWYNYYESIESWAIDAFNGAEIEPRKYRVDR